MEPHRPYKPIQNPRLNRKHILQIQTHRLARLPRRELSLQPPHRSRIDRVLRLARQHQRHERLEPPVPRARAPVGQPLAPHRVHRRVGRRAAWLSHREDGVVGLEPGCRGLGDCSAGGVCGLAGRLAARFRGGGRCRGFEFQRGVFIFGYAPALSGRAGYGVFDVGAGGEVGGRGGGCVADELRGGAGDATGGPLRCGGEEARGFFGCFRGAHRGGCEEAADHGRALGELGEGGGCRKGFKGTDLLHCSVECGAWWASFRGSD